MKYLSRRASEVGDARKRWGIIQVSANPASAIIAIPRRKPHRVLLHVVGRGRLLMNS